MSFFRLCQRSGEAFASQRTGAVGLRASQRRLSLAIGGGELHRSPAVLRSCTVCFSVGFACRDDRRESGAGGCCTPALLGMHFSIGRRVLSPLPLKILTSLMSLPVDPGFGPPLRGTPRDRCARPCHAAQGKSLRRGGRVLPKEDALEIRMTLELESELSKVRARASARFSDRGDRGMPVSS